MCAPWEDGDFSSAEWAHPEIECVIRGDQRPAPRRAFNNHDRLGQCGDDPIPRGKSEGVGQMRAKGASLFHVGDGKVTKLVLYNDRERALADLGLAPEADSLGS